MAGPEAPEFLDFGTAKGPKAEAPEVIENFEGYEPSMGMVLGTAAKNFPSSAVGVLQSMVEPILSPIETGKAIGQIGAGAYSKAKGALGFSQDPEEKAQQEAAINAVGEHFAERYGSKEGFRKAFMEDPAGIMMDLSTVLTGGGALAARGPALASKAGQIASKVPGAAKVVSAIEASPTAAAIGKGVEEVGEAAQTIGRSVDPFSLGLKTAEKGIEYGAKAAALPISLKSGASVRSLQQAVDAGLTANPTFVRHLTGEGTADDVVNAVQGAVRAVADERSAEYLKRMQGPRASTVPLSFTPAMNELYKQSQKHSHLKGPTSALSEAYNAIGDYQMAGKNTIDQFDKLKQRLDEIRDSYRSDSRAFQALTAVRQSVYNTIANQSSEYAKAMEAYQTASKKLDELKAGLAADRNAPISKQMTKILKAQKSPFGSSLLDDLDRLNPDLKYMIAGQELSQVLPVGSMRQAIIGSAIPGQIGLQVAGKLDPAMMAVHAATLPFASPLVGGSVLGGAGLAAGVPKLAGEVYGRVPAMARYAPYQAAQVIEAAKEDEEEPTGNVITVNPRSGRASGGRVKTASQLMMAVEDAKRKVNNTTKPLMNVPDEHIAQALAVANKHLED